MKLLFDLFPILLFFIAYKLAGIYIATIVAIFASTLEVFYTYVRYRRFETLQLVTMGLILVLGGATLWLHNELFIKWKPTLVNWLFGLFFLGSEFFGKEPFIQRLMKSQITLPSGIWISLNRAWSIFFLAMGFINLYVVYHFDTNTWVNFKLFGMMGLTFVFVILQAIFLSRHIKNL
jgi:intracellular septation protein